jgi:hypothetical protein
MKQRILTETNGNRKSNTGKLTTVHEVQPSVTRGDVLKRLMGLRKQPLILQKIYNRNFPFSSVFTVYYQIGERKNNRNSVA